MNSKDCTRIGALWAISQGVLTAVVPQLSVKLFKRMMGVNFDGVENLQAKPAYLRQLRAVGIGLAAAGIASLVMERVAADDDPSEADE
jgi:hypothetical protein